MFTILWTFQPEAFLLPSLGLGLTLFSSCSARTQKKGHLAEQKLRKARARAEESFFYRYVISHFTAAEDKLFDGINYEINLLDRTVSGLGLDSITSKILMAMPFKYWVDLYDISREYLVRQRYCR